jgi:hypothetical protein
MFSCYKKGNSSKNASCRWSHPTQTDTRSISAILADANGHAWTFSNVEIRRPVGDDLTCVEVLTWRTARMRMLWDPWLVRSLRRCRRRFGIGWSRGVETSEASPEQHGPRGSVLNSLDRINNSFSSYLSRLQAELHVPRSHDFKNVEMFVWAFLAFQ